jgi:hypothetical protein
MKVDISGLHKPMRALADDIQVFDIMRSKQGKIYWVVAIPPDQPTVGRDSHYLYYFSLDANGEVIRAGQCMAAAAERDWVKIGRCEMSIGEPEWFI